MRVKIKICGLTNLADAQAAVNAGADLLGFIFFAKSPRCVQPDLIKELITGLDKRNALTVGVFVNETPEYVYELLSYCQLDLAQLHGEEPAQDFGLGADTRRIPTQSCRCYKALRPKNEEEAWALAKEYSLSESERRGDRLPSFLIDAYHPQRRGGTGQIGDLKLAADLARKYPFLLAGGLKPENVQHVIQSVNPWGIDVSSGIESQPGKKDHARMFELMEKVKKMQENQ